VYFQQPENKAVAHIHRFSRLECKSKSWVYLALFSQAHASGTNQLNAVSPFAV
jgi:hypothetical protein